MEQKPNTASTDHRQWPEMRPVIDVMEDAEAQPVGAKDLAQVVAYSDEMLTIERELEAMAEQMKAKSQRYAKIQLDLLPDVMLAIGMKKFTLSSGYVVEIGDFVRGTIPTTNQIEQADEFDRGILLDRRSKALAWLKERGAESLIKNQVIALFGKGQDDDAKKLFARIQGEGFLVKCEEEINFQTLNSYLKEALKAGTVVPTDAFALFSGRKATIKPPPKGKSSKKGAAQ
jgi:hypothetical protein